MPTFRVGVLEVWVRSLIVDAEDKQQAVLQIVDGGEGVEESFMHLRYDPPETWPVEDTEPEEILMAAIAAIGKLREALISVGVPGTSSMFYDSDALFQRMAKLYERKAGESGSSTDNPSTD